MHDEKRRQVGAQQAVVRWSDRYDPRAHALWIVLGAIGVVTLTLGQYFGGVLVYRIGFRVYEGRAPTQPKSDSTEGGKAP